MARKNTKDNRPRPEEMSYEDALAELESINERIEQGAIGLEESLAEYQRGMSLARRCTSILDQAEQELKKIKPVENRESGAEARDE